MAAKHMRLPNGFGQISKIKKPLRNPYRAMISTGTNPDTGHKISKVLGYYKTYNDAYQALMNYHKNPYDATNIITLEELHDKWHEEWVKHVAKSTDDMMRSAWKRCTKLYKANIRDIRPAQIKECVDLAPSFPTKNYVKTLFNNMLDYALSFDWVEHNYARNFTITYDYQVAEPHIAFTEQEIDMLWTLTEYQTARMILMQCYMGWRPQELCNLLTKNVNIHDQIIIGGMKTKAGTNRVVPIPKKVKKLIEQEYNSDNSFLFVNSVGRHINHKLYSTYFDQFITEHGLNIKHRPHDGRKTFVTMAKRKGLDEYAIKYIVGHTISDITEKVYTERDPDWLRKQINLV